MTLADIEGIAVTISIDFLGEYYCYSQSDAPQTQWDDTIHLETNGNHAGVLESMKNSTITLGTMTTDVAFEEALSKRTTRSGAGITHQPPLQTIPQNTIRLHHCLAMVSCLNHGEEGRHHTWYNDHLCCLVVVANQERCKWTTHNILRLESCDLVRVRKFGFSAYTHISART